MTANTKYTDTSIQFGRALLVLLLLYVFSGPARSQSGNLVPNPSFEKKVHFDIRSGSNWSKCLKNDTPDYIEFTKRGEPEFYYRKYIGGLLPYDGEAYVGIFCFRTNELMGVYNIREFIQIPLKSTLEKDSIYRISLVIALDPESTTAIDNFNILLCRETFQYKREKQMFEHYPQIRFRGDYLESTRWIELDTTFKARGWESHLVLGNLFPDVSLKKKTVSFESEMQEKWDLQELEKAAYYYIDMVSLMKESEWLALNKPEEPEEEEPIVEPEPELPEELPDEPVIDIRKVRLDSSVILNNIFFEFDKSELLPASNRELDRLYSQLMLHKDLSIVIEGHTDNMGTFEYNIDLSNRRAMAVVNYLLEKGLPQERISFEAYGYTRPISNNRDAEGRQRNRRVAFRILDDQ